ncbi:PKD domain-containing protein [Aridibaculum aurantiacum]|uniref:PKD domain-containing protein n=1 Tax=Aridibaculum aurantiacum TaxID=2810307 RepID=UPI001A96CCBC|nr:PKD domain-containing protein [Aridibaculum aurantiacum]
MKARKRWLQLLQLLLIVSFASTASAQLTANFSATTTSGCPPLIVNFQDQSTGNPTSWRWDLGNGTQSVVANPIGTYFDPGTYTVKLVVRNVSNNADSIVRTQYITVHALPQPAFTASDTIGCFPLRVQFTDNSTAGAGTISSWQWDFGDGNISNQRNPLHTYNSAGNFTVILNTVNSFGCARVLTKPLYIRTTGGVRADFTHSNPASCQPPTPVSFTNTSTGTGVMSYIWHFGDGNTSTQANPVHNYTAVGVYTVRLIAVSPNGCTDTIVKPNLITVGAVQANFTRPDTVCVGAGARFTNTSTPTIVSSYWTFGDGTNSSENNPQKVYTTPGVYQVKLVNDFGACRDSITRSIVVVAKPTASFTASATNSCQTPFTVTFTNASTGATSYRWTFSNGFSSTAQNPTTTFSQPGNYTITLIARNASGCADTMQVVSMITVSPPRVTAINNLNVRGCIPYTVTPVANVQSAYPIASYNWDFGDGGTSTDINPSHTYTVPGIYTVKLVVTTSNGCRDSMVVQSAAMVGSKPTANFAAAPLDVCAYVPVYFGDSSTNGPIHEWLWDFGDGATSTLQHPNHYYDDTGHFTIRLVVFNYGCSDTLELRDYVYIRPPIANFDTAFNCNDPLTRRFTDRSIGATAWSWEFGDGNTSTVASPTHTYAAPGVYRVRLTVTNGNCSHSRERDVMVINEGGQLQVSDSIGCRNTNFNFHVANINGGNIANYTWFFDSITGPGVAGGAISMSRVYTEAGNYPAAVEMTDLLGCRDTLFTRVPVVIFGPRADFTATPSGTCFNTVVTFHDATQTDGTHPVVSWTWHYGDGTVTNYTAPPFTHTYTNNGVYDSKLVVEDSYGCKDSIVRNSVVTISRPVADFSISDSLKCPSAEVAFTNNSTGGFDVAYLWSFGDGNSSTDVNPIYAYPAQGTYTVKLVMTDRYGCSDSTERTIRIYNPTANFLMSDSFSSCPPLLVNFTNQSANYVAVNWDFGDGGNSQLENPSRMYTYPGIYNVRLTVTNTGGCTDTISNTITIQGPTGVFSYSPLTICSQGEVSFTAVADNAVNYIWDFNDGNIEFGTQPTTTHMYSNGGTYFPKLILEDAAGCKVPLVGLDTIRVLEVQTHILAQPRLICDSGIVAFSDSTITNDPVASYQWNFGDGATATGSNPTHNYNTTGWFNVSLITTTQFGCADTAVYNNFIKIASSPRVTILGDTAACEPAVFTFQGGLVAPDTSSISWSWNFGNGNVILGQNPTAQSFAAPGNYPVQLSVVNSDGCTATVATTAVVHPRPVVNAGIDTTICRFDSYTLNATGASSYTWAANSSLSCTDCASPVITPTGRDTYYVTGTSAFGCVNSDSVTINVKQPFTVSVSRNDTLCVGETRLLHARGAEFYNWTPARWLDNPTSASPRARPDSTITYTVVGSDDHDCFTDSAFVTLTVFPIPRIEILNGDVITMMVGSSQTINTRSSPDVTSWRWMPSQFLSCATCPQPVTTPNQEITYSVLASNDGRCIARDQVVVKLICDNANIYVPNTFSPNGDGMNDVFYPRGTGLYTIKSMRIFNRWGQMLFEKVNISANNASQGWDGKFNGQQVQTDVYVYVIEAICDNNTIVPIKGNVTLLR